MKFFKNNNKFIFYSTPFFFDYSLNLSILIREGKENNYDFESNGE